MSNYNFILKLSWASEGKCAIDPNKDHNFFYPTVKASRKQGGRLDQVEAERAKFCLGLNDGFICPVKQECLEHALANDEQGVWGGMTEDERKQFKRSRAARKRKSA